MWKQIAIFALYIIMYKANEYGKPEKQQPVANRAEGRGRSRNLC